LAVYVRERATMKSPYTKPALHIDEQIAKLQTLGMQISDHAAAKHCLQHISYYRLSAYWLPFEHPKSQAGLRFKEGTTFEDVVSLYEFDRKLRLLVLDAIERVEVAVRGSWAYQMAMLGGAHGYVDVANYTSSATYYGNYSKLAAEVGRSKDTFIVHYKDIYAGPAMPPVWMTAELLTFGQLSQWYAALKEPKVRNSIAKVFELDEVIFVGLVHQLVVIRNICAHHSRLWNRTLNVQFTFPRKKPAILIAALNRNADKKIYNSLVMLQFLLAKAEPQNNWGHRLVTLLATLPAGYEDAMGFPNDWTQLTLWR
jgi:abortive infection bacteriophage resistance protein